MVGKLHALNTHTAWANRDDDNAVNPDTLRLLRERLGCTQKELGESIGKKSSHVSRAEKPLDTENGETERLLPVGAKAAFAAALNVPAAVLNQPFVDAPIDSIHFRSRSIPQRNRAQALAEGRIAARSLGRLLELADIPCTSNIPEYDADDFEDGARGVARQVRQDLGVGLDAPIGAIGDLIENLGVYIVPLRSNAGKVDAMTVRATETTPPVLALAPNAPNDRKRFTLAHELGHLCLDRLTLGASQKEKEQRADDFAGEFLVPYAQYAGRLAAWKPAQMSRLIRMAWQWGMSPSAFVVGATRHGELTDAQPRYWHQQLAQRDTTGEATPRFPVKFSRAARVALIVKDQLGWSEVDLIDRLGFFGPELDKIIDGWPFRRYTPPMGEYRAPTGVLPLSTAI